MKRFRIGKSVYQITVYDPLPILSQCKQNNIKLYSFLKVEQYTYRFKVSYFAAKKIESSIPGVKLIRKEGFFGIIRSLFHYKTTLIALMIGCICFAYLSTLTLNIMVRGDSKQLEPLIEEQLQLMGVKRFSGLPNNEDLLALETEISKALKDKIEWLEIRRNGNLVIAQFLKRRTTIEIPKPGDNMYALKDGMIRFVRVSKGIVMVKANQYVREGDLLVSAYLDKTNGDRVYIGTKGSVYATTWAQIEASVDKAQIPNLKEDEIFLLLMEKVHEELSFIINGNDEKIENETILQFTPNESKIRMSVHYTLLEDITR